MRGCVVCTGGVLRMGMVAVGGVVFVEVGMGWGGVMVIGVCMGMTDAKSSPHG